MFFASQLMCPSSSLSGGGTMNSRFFKGSSLGLGNKKRHQTSKHQDTPNLGKTVILSHSDHLSLFIPPQKIDILAETSSDLAVKAVRPVPSRCDATRFPLLEGELVIFEQISLQSKPPWWNFGDKLPSLMSLMCAEI